MASLSCAALAASTLYLIVLGSAAALGGHLLQQRRRAHGQTREHPAGLCAEERHAPASTEARWACGTGTNADQPRRPTSRAARRDLYWSIALPLAL